MSLRLLIVLPAALALAACAARPTPYQPQDGATGYAEQQIDATTWRVQFAGNFDTPRQTVENYLLYRSAEIMLFGGHDRFVVLDKEVERTVEYRGYGYHPYHFGFGLHHGHGHGHFHHFDHYYGPGDYYPLTSYAAYATIRTYTGGPPPDGLRVYDARELIRQLGPTVVLPQNAAR
ncbi:MAG: hypothetical protein ACE5GS_02545 [Kiloniellaceae bacterium]